MFRFFLLTVFFVTSLGADCVPFEDSCYNCQYHCGSFYTSIGGGGVFPCKNSRTRGDSTSILYTPTQVGTSEFALPDVTWKNKYEPGFEINAAVGVNLKQDCRLEAEFLYQNFKRKISGSYNWMEVNALTTQLFAQNFDNPLMHASSKTNVYSLLTNLNFDYRASIPITFSFGGGVGIAWMESNRKEQEGVLHVVSVTPPINETSPTLEKSAKLFGTAFAWQVKIALKYDLQDSLSIGLGYRLFGTTRFQASTSRIIVNPESRPDAVFKVPRDEVRGLLNNSINLSADYRF